MCPDFFGHLRKRLDKKAKINLKIYDLITGEKIIIIHISTYISRNSKGITALLRSKIILAIKSSVAKLVNQFLYFWCFCKMIEFLVSHIKNLP